MQASRSGRRPFSFYALAAFFTLFVLFLYGPMSAIFILSFQGPNGGLTFPLNGVSLNWFYALFQQQRTGDIAGSFARSIVARGHRPGADGHHFRDGRARLPASVPRLRLHFLHGDREPDHAGPSGQPRHRPDVPVPGLEDLLVHFGAGRASDLDPAVRAPDHVRGVQPVQSRLRGGGARPRRGTLRDPLDDRAADPVSRHDRGRAVRFHPVLRRVSAHPGDGGPAQHLAARDLEHDHQRHLARAVRDRHGHDCGLLRRDRARAVLDRAHPKAPQPEPGAGTTGDRTRGSSCGSFETSGARP